MSTDVLDLPMTSSPAEAEDSLRDELASVVPVICYRDPADVRTIRRQGWLIIISFVIAAVAVVGVVYKSKASSRAKTFRRVRTMKLLRM